MALSNAEIIDHIKNISVLQLSQLIRELEDALGVKAASGVMMAAPAAAAAGAAAPAAPVEEAKTEFDVILKDAGAKKIQVIKVVRELTNLGLKEAKELVEGAPKTVKEAVSKEEAEKAKAKFEAEGAVVEIK